VSRTDVVPEREWDRSPYRVLAHTPVGCGHSLACFVPFPEGGGKFHAVTLARPRAERRDFSLRDRMLVREAVAAVVPLIGGPLAGFDEPSPADLSPRVRQVLRCLLEGDGDKQVATRLGISRFTVNEYTKTLYRHFRVQGRAELLALWVRRSRRGPFAWDLLAECRESVP
jgi:DNA-binding CsgD family transcriptional regulator